MCDCIEKKEAALKELGLENAAFIANKDSINRTYSEFKYEKRKKAIVNHEYCPFCGNKYK